jgi:hypothetical protein
MKTRKEGVQMLLGLVRRCPTMELAHLDQIFLQLKIMVL